jgi:hypothetical protein
MKIYRIKIRGDKYPTEYVVQASGWATAVGRAVREWKQRFKGSRTEELHITAFSSGKLLQAEEKNGQE